ncbi:MAG: T9SS type A sorting domain-containing protein [Bacteroidales bacterium]|nr:T9SS type A sorting domain-containing protein [Bacteroidales bacterium]
MKTKLFFFLLVLVTGFSQAQWSSDPAANNQITSLTGDQTLPKVATAPNGDTYISWFSNEAGNYNVRLQRFDVNGNEMWASGGILISDNTSMSWITDYDLSVDTYNHALVTFMDIRNGSMTDIFGYRTSPEGEFVWGDNGICLSGNPEDDFEPSPQVTYTNDGYSVFAWQRSLDVSTVLLQKVAPNGDKLWGDNGIEMIPPAGKNYERSYLVPCMNSDVIMVWIRVDGSGMYAPRNIVAQRFDANGAEVWSEIVSISTIGGISAWTEPEVRSDGMGGATIAWHAGAMISLGYAQHLFPDGSTQFPQNGVRVSMMSGRNNFTPSAAYQAATDEVFVFWKETNSDQNQYGLYGQRISPTGERLWTENGKAIFGLSSMVYDFIITTIDGADAIVTYEKDYNTNTTIKAMKIDENGDYVWNDENVFICSTASSKTHLDVGNFQNGQIILSWGDGRTGDPEIFAQNIRSDGLLGPGGPIPVQTINLSVGYQFASSHIQADNPDMIEVLSPILNDNLDFVRDSEGGMFRKIGPNWVNGIGDWVGTEGYLFKMFAADELTIEGTFIDPSTPIALEVGFQFVSYLPESSADALLAFASILNDNLDFIRDSEGGMLRKIGPNWVNGIGNANPGEGYLVKMFAEGELIYPANELKTSDNPNINPSHFIFEGGNAAEPVYTLYLEGLEIGEEVAAYDGNIILGSTVIVSENAFDNSLPVFSVLNDSKGYIAGDAINLKIWKTKENIEFINEFSFDNSVEGAYTGNVYPNGDGQYSLVKFSNASNEEKEIVTIYPNPANEILNIESNEKIIDLKIYNGFGQIVFSSSPQNNKFNINTSEFTSGVYFVKIKTNSENIVREIAVY